MFKEKHKIISLMLIILTLMASLAVISNKLHAESKIADSDIAEALKVQLKYDTHLSNGDITTDVKEGIVIVKGQLTNLYEKERLIDIIESINSHHGFVDLVEVQPDHVLPDNLLTLKIENLLMRDAVAESYEVGVKVMNGEAVLSGEVDSYVEKLHAENVAKRVPGIKKVDNNLTINFNVKRLDSEIRQEIISKIKNDVRLEAYMLDVKVKDGVAEISGVVGSEDNRQRLKNKAWVAGVKSVNVEKVSTEMWAKNEMLTNDRFQKVSNLELKKRINAALAYDPRVFSYDIEVEVNSPFVTLRGEVSSLEEKEAAEADVKNIRGVIAVKNDIKVESYDAVPTNSELKKRVQKLLHTDEVGNFTDITVYASQGHVYLNGLVKTKYLAKRAETLIQDNLEGVVHIDNNLEHEFPVVVLPDYMLKANSYVKLMNNPFVNASRIKLLINDGIITLNGRVQNFTEYQIAESVLYQCGAKAVINDLDVSSYTYQRIANLK